MPSKISGQITVTTAGTEVSGTSTGLRGIYYVQALAANTGKMYVGNNGDNTVSSSTGYELAAGQDSVWELEDLNQLLVDSSVNGEKVCWRYAGAFGAYG